MRELLDASNRTRDICISIAYRLESLSLAFQAVGNPTVATQLQDLAEEARFAGDTIDNAVGEAIYVSAREAEQSFANTVNAALAGIKVGSNAK